MRKTKYLSHRVTEDFHEYLGRLASALSEKEQRIVKVADVTRRLIDLGLPFLEQDLGEYLSDNVAQKQSQSANLAAAIRLVKTGADRLGQLVDNI